MGKHAAPAAAAEDAPPADATQSIAVLALHAMRAIMALLASQARDSCSCATCQDLQRLGATLMDGVADRIIHQAQLSANHDEEYYADDLQDLPLTTSAAHRVAWGALCLDRHSRRGFLLDAELHLTRDQFKLLWALCEAAGGVLTIEELSRAVYGQCTGNDRGRLYAHIRRIRRLLERDPSHPSLILAVRGEGFRLAEEPSAATTAVTWRPR